MALRRSCDRLVRQPDGSAGTQADPQTITGQAKHHQEELALQDRLTDGQDRPVYLIRRSSIFKNNSLRPFQKNVIPGFYAAWSV